MTEPRGSFDPYPLPLSLITSITADALVLFSPRFVPSKLIAALHSAERQTAHIIHCLLLKTYMIQRYSPKILFNGPYFLEMSVLPTYPLIWAPNE